MLQQLADDGVADEESGGGNGQAAVAEDEGAGGQKAVDRGPQRVWKLRKKGLARVFCGSGTTIGHGRRQRLNGPGTTIGHGRR